MKVASVRKAVWGLLGAAIAAALSLAFAAGHHRGKAAALLPADFHDLRVSHSTDYVRLIEPSHPAVEAAAERLSTPEEAYYFVRDSIAFDPAAQSAPASDTLRERRANCIGKAALLCSLYRAQGADSGQVRVVVGEVKVAGRAVDHAWVDLEQQGTCLQQDPSDLVGWFEFDDFEGGAYSEWFAERERFCFNDKGFAVVSPLNLLLGGSAKAD